MIGGDTISVRPPRFSDSSTLLRSALYSLTGKVKYESRIPHAKVARGGTVVETKLRRNGTLRDPSDRTPRQRSVAHLATVTIPIRASQAGRSRCARHKTQDTSELDLPSTHAYGDIDKDTMRDWQSSTERGEGAYFVFSRWFWAPPSRAVYPKILKRD